jgi:hypothetical protein
MSEPEGGSTAAADGRCDARVRGPPPARRACPLRLEETYANPAWILL